MQIQIFFLELFFFRIFGQRGLGQSEFSSSEEKKLGLIVYFVQKRGPHPLSDSDAVAATGAVAASVAETVDADVCADVFGTYDKKWQHCIFFPS